MPKWINLPALLAVICWGTMGPLAKPAFDAFPSSAYLGLRPLLAATAAFSVLAIQRKRVRLPRSAIPVLFLAGSIGFGLTQFGYVKGLDFTGVSHHAVLVSASPLMAAILLPIANRTRVNRLAIIGTFVGLLGVVLLVGGGDRTGSTIHGDLIALASSAIWVGVVVWPMPLMQKLDVEVINAWLLAFSLVFILPFCTPALVDVARNPPHAGAWLAVLYGGLVGIWFGNLIWYRAIHEIGVDQIMVYQYLTPLVSLVIAVVFLDESIGVVQAAGSLLILLGVAIVRLRPAVLKSTERESSSKHSEHTETIQPLPIIET